MSLTPKEQPPWAANGENRWQRIDIHTSQQQQTGADGKGRTWSSQKTHNPDTSWRRPVKSVDQHDSADYSSLRNVIGWGATHLRVHAVLLWKLFSFST